MKHTTWSGWMMAAVVATAALPETSDATRYVAHGTLVSGPAAVRVWVEDGDMFPDYRNVTLRVQPERDCYTSLFLVDTAGYIHVLNANDAWLHGGRTYRYHAGELGLGRLQGRGIAYVFAVGSPVPFDYSYYGAAVYPGGFGYRIVGDPFTGSREFYMSLLPATCRWDHVGVAYTRFYVRDWVRYPSYLCAGSHVRVGDWCRHCEPVYTTYRYHVASPYDAMRPVVRYKDRSRHTADVRQVVRATYREPAQEPVRSKASSLAKETRKIKSHDSARVVSTSREIARSSAHIEKSRSDAPVIARAADASEPKMVAMKGRNQKQSSLAHATREKGAGKKVRQAE